MGKERLEEVNLVSLRDKVILESFPDEIRGTPLLSKSKIVIPGQYAETSRLAKVIAIGPKVTEVKPGQTVLCNRYPTSALSFRYEERELVSVLEGEILARIEVKP